MFKPSKVRRRDTSRFSFLRVSILVFVIVEADTEGEDASVVERANSDEDNEASADDNVPAAVVDVVVGAGKVEALGLNGRGRVGGKCAPPKPANVEFTGDIFSAVQQVTKVSGLKKKKSTQHFKPGLWLSRLLWALEDEGAEMERGISPLPLSPFRASALPIW
jgi:hypothetical protein